MKCPLCSGKSLPRFRKEGRAGLYTVAECRSCGLWHIDPIPSAEELSALYQGEYFETRTDRGYNDYTSETVKKSVLSTLHKNMTDLGLLQMESRLLPEDRTVLEIGSAAGYFLEWMQGRGWTAEGIEISRPMAAAAKQKGLSVRHGDFLQESFPEEHYFLTAMWATLEHLSNPRDFIEKIYRNLKPGGYFVFTTAHTGLFARLYGKQWRYLNVPEHIYYWNRKSLDTLLEPHFQRINSFTYGSGFTSRQGAGPFYSFLKRYADSLARTHHRGDMIAALYRKR